MSEQCPVTQKGRDRALLIVAAAWLTAISQVSCLFSPEEGGIRSRIPRKSKPRRGQDTQAENAANFQPMHNLSPRMVHDEKKRST